MAQKSYWVHRTKISPLFLNKDFKTNHLPALITYKSYVNYSQSGNYDESSFLPLPHDFLLGDNNDKNLMKILKDAKVDKTAYLKLRSENYNEQLNDYFNDGLYIQRQLLETTATCLGTDEQAAQKALEKLMNKEGMGFATKGELSGLSNRDLLNVAILLEIPAECLTTQTMPQPVFEKAEHPKEIYTAYYQLQVMDKVIPTQFIKSANVVSGADNLAYDNPNYNSNYHILNGMHDKDVIEKFVSNLRKQPYNTQISTAIYAQLKQCYNSTQSKIYINLMDFMGKFVAEQGKLPADKELLNDINQTVYVAKRNSRTKMEVQRDNLQEMDISNLSADEIATNLKTFFAASQDILRELYRENSYSIKFIDAVSTFLNAVENMDGKMLKKLQSSKSFNEISNRVETIKLIAIKVKEQQKVWEENVADIYSENQTEVDNANAKIKTSQNAMSFLNYSVCADNDVQLSILNYLKQNDISQFSDEQCFKIIQEIKEATKQKREALTQ